MATNSWDIISYRKNDLFNSRTSGIMPIFMGVGRSEKGTYRAEKRKHMAKSELGVSRTQHWLKQKAQ